jgi:hypothetical protein
MGLSQPEAKLNRSLLIRPSLKLLQRHFTSSGVSKKKIGANQLNDPDLTTIAHQHQRSRMPTNDHAKTKYPCPNGLRVVAAKYQGRRSQESFMPVCMMHLRISLLKAPRDMFRQLQITLFDSGCLCSRAVTTWQLSVVSRQNQSDRVDVQGPGWPPT